VGTLPPQRLQAAISAAYTAAEDQDGSSLAAAPVLDAVPEAEAEVIRAELAKIKLSGEPRLASLWRGGYRVRDVRRAVWLWGAAVHGSAYGSLLL